MTPAGVVALRKATALVHGVPGLRLRLAHKGHFLAEVGHDVVVRTDASPMRLTPCQLRVALLRVIDDAVLGRPISAFGLPVGVDPAVHLGACRASGTAVHTFGLVERLDGCWFASTLPERCARAVLERCVGEAGLSGLDVVDHRLRYDERLGTSVVQLYSTVLGVDAQLDLAHTTHAACGVEELATSLLGARR